MLLGRTEELKYLNNFYDRTGSQILVVYGQKMIGKTALAREFVQDKPHFYYQCRTCSEREQLYLWGEELGKMGIKTLKFPSFPDVFEASVDDSKVKQVLIIDEFQNIVKNSSDFMGELVSFINNRWNDKEVLVVLLCSSIGWVENCMVNKIGESAYELSGLLKVKELDFSDLKDYYSGFSMEDLVNVYALFGGIPGLWRFFNDKKSLKENICNIILSQTGALYEVGEKIVTEELREPNVYHSILSSIAEGCNKLNDLYLKTGFSRAKISVYLKNMIELEIVEKVFSFDSEGKENVQKGIYKIANHLVDFYFKFIYPNKSSLEQMTTGEFFTTYIHQTLKYHTAYYFSEICMEYMSDLNKRGILPINAEMEGKWIGKTGNIDLVMQDENGKTLIGACNWEKPMMSYEDYEWLLFNTGKAKLEPNYIYLFSMSRFDEKLTLEAKIKKTMKLVTLKEMK